MTSALIDINFDNLPELDPGPAPLASLEADMQRFFNILWRGAPYGMFQNLNAGPDHDKRRSIYIPDGEPASYPSAWDNNYSNIFHGVNPTIVRREYFEASRSADIAAINQLYREYDAKDFSDPTQTEIAACLPIVKAKDDQRVADAIALDADTRVRPASPQALQNQARDMAKDAKFKANPALYMSMVRDHVDALTPAPSVIVKSGGGYQCYWLLAGTLIIRTHVGDQAAHVQSYAEDLQKRWVHLDPRADQGVNDLRRILRTPGTFNHKPKYAPNYPQVTFYQKRFDLRYTLAGFVQMLPAPMATESPRTAQDRTQATTAQNSAPYAGDSVIDAYNAKYRLADLLTQYGYSYAGNNRYSRPGAQTEGVELFPNENNARIWSGNDPLHNGEHRCTPFTVMCVYDHNGDIRAAVKAAAAELGMLHEKKAPSPAFSETIQAARTWLQTANFAELIPAALQSAKGYRTLATDKRVYSAFLDLFAKYGSARGPISNQQLSLASGLSEGSVRNAIKRLIAACLLGKIAPPADSDNTGAGWYELLSLDYFISCVLCAVEFILFNTYYRAKYATDVFTQHKADDAFQRGGSKRQRQIATIKAIGPDGLILLDILSAYGRQTQTAISTRTHQSKYTVSRLVKRLEEYEIVTVESEWKHHFVSLNADWLETVKELAPKMPTYGLQRKREISAPARTIDNCDRLLARKLGNTERIERQREKAAHRLFDLIEQEAVSHFEDERVNEIMQRFTQHNASRRAAPALIPFRPHPAVQAKLEQMHAEARMDLAEQRHKEQWETGRLLAENIENLKASGTPKRQWFDMLTIAGFTPIEAKRAIALGGAV